MKPLLDSSELSLLDELKLRRSARQHYVVADQRLSQWHAVVLDEMCRKDEELAEEELHRPTRRYAPIADGMRYDRAEAAAAPRFLASPLPVHDLYYT